REKANRKSQSEFECRQCGFKTHADLNGAANIRARARVNAPKVSEKRKPAKYRDKLHLKRASV
ncbi:MAG TPA: zinc ribbon domain-containing protein, partial [Blastocatellia bacterium]|nr:zinc ribbon domain-containing protein [Blastocatellia bacterium]